MTKTSSTAAKAKSTPIRKKVVRATRSKNNAAPALKSFKQAPDIKFLTFKFTRQTIYWLIIGTMVVSLAGWVLVLQLQITSIYQNIEFNTNAIETYLPVKQNHIKRP